MNSLKDWLDGGRGRRTSLARHLAVVPSFVHKMASGEKPVPLEHAATIETFTSGEVTRKDLRPNDWQRIWPELADQASANQVI